MREQIKSQHLLSVLPKRDSWPCLKCKYGEAGNRVTPGGSQSRSKGGGRYKEEMLAHPNWVQSWSEELPNRERILPSRMGIGEERVLEVLQTQM